MTYTEFLDNSPMTKFLWFLLFGVTIAEILDGMDFQMTSFALPGLIKSFHLDPAQAGAIPSAGNIGLMVGAVFCSLISDHIGRKATFKWILFLFAFGSFLSAIAPSYTILLLARFVTGLGLGAELPVGTTILAEFAPRRYRHIFITVVPLVWAVGWIVAAVLSIKLIPAYGWRSLYWVGVVPAAFMALVRFFLPESVRWLLAKGKVEEAGAICNELARKAGMTNIKLVPPELPANQVKLNFAQQLKLLSAVRDPMIAIAFLYFCYYLQNWGVYAWLPTIFVRHGYTLTKSFTFTLIILCMTPLAQLNGGLIQEKMNRKWALFFMTAVGTVFFLIFGLSFYYNWPIYVTVGAQMLQMLFAHGVIAIMYTLSAELFPTPVRNLGIGLVQAVGRTGAVVGPFTIGLLLKGDTTITHIIYYFAAPMVIATTIGLFIINFDPRQRTLEQISHDVGASGEPLAATNMAH